MDLRSSAFKRNFVHGKFHQVDSASVKRRFGSIDCSDLKLPTQIISATSFPEYFFGA